MAKNGILKNVSLEQLENDPSAFWRGIKEIGANAFSFLGVDNLFVPNGVKRIDNEAFSSSFIKQIFLSSSIVESGDFAFAHSPELKIVDISKTKIKAIGESTFDNCYSLSLVKLPKACKEIGESAFKNCYELRAISLPRHVEKLHSHCFMNCNSLVDIDFSKTLEEIGESAFENCASLEDVILPFGVETIQSRAFYNCSNLSYVYIPSSFFACGKDVFGGCPLRYLSFNRDGSKELSKQPKQTQQTKQMFDLSNCYRNILNFSYMGETMEEIETLVVAAEVAEKNKIKLTSDFVFDLKYAGQFDNFCSSNFKFFHQIQSFLPKEMSEDNLTGLLTFAFDIGCFSKNEKLAQRSTEWLKERLTKKEIGIFELSSLFLEWKPNGENEEFSNFLFSKNQNKNITIFEQIKAEFDYSMFLKKIYEEFCDQNGRLSIGGRFRDEKGNLMFAIAHKYIDENGNEHTRRKNRIPTVELFRDYFVNTKFFDVVTEEDAKIVGEFSKWHGMKQADFAEAKQIMREYHSNNIPANILGFHLNGFAKDIETYKRKTQVLFDRGVQDLENVATQISEQTREFTFDWIEKNDPMNFCLGLYCDCCATLANVGYGIAKSVFVNPNIQNLVIKDKDGLPVAKSTAFLNRDEGYVVFNNVEVSKRVSEDEKDDLYREFMRGVYAFAEAFNKQNPKKPINIMTVGMSHNDLENQIKRELKRTRPRQGVHFGMYGSYMRDYDGDWLKSGQYKLWGKIEEGKNETREL